MSYSALLCSAVLCPVRRRLKSFEFDLSRNSVDADVKSMYCIILRDLEIQFLVHFFERRGKIMFCPEAVVRITGEVPVHRDIFAHFLQCTV